MAKTPKAQGEDPEERLERVADLISERITGNIDQLIAQLTADEGLKMLNRKGVHVAQMHGLQGKGAFRELALRNWGNAARRALMQTG